MKIAAQVSVDGQPDKIKEFDTDQEFVSWCIETLNEGCALQLVSVMHIDESGAPIIAG